MQLGRGGSKLVGMRTWCFVVVSSHRSQNAAHWEPLTGPRGLRSPLSNLGVMNEEDEGAKAAGGAKGIDERLKLPSPSLFTRFAPGSGLMKSAPRF